MRVLNGIYLLQLGLKTFKLFSFFLAEHLSYGGSNGRPPGLCQVCGVHNVKKPTTMAPSTLVDHAQTLFSYATYLSMDENTAGLEIPMAQQRQMMLTMFPEPWVRNFTNSGQNPSTVTVAAMLAYMNDQLNAEVINNKRKCGFDGGQHGNNQRMHHG
jgi:hypothetical protein